MAGGKVACSYVPPHVLENLARRGDTPIRTRARASVQQGKITRDRRRRRPAHMTTLLAGSGVSSVMPPPSATAGRAVFDCQHQWVQQVALARGEGDPATGDTDVDLVYDYAGLVREFFKKELNRDSIDNLKMNLVLNVHFGVGFMNAFWDGDEMTFGDGDGVIFTSFARSLDVTAHELGHGVTQFTANLDYYSQSGALNEHFSDVFGTVITQYAENQDANSADWLIGNEIMGPTLFGESLRSMKAPGTAYDNALMGKDIQPTT